MDTCRASLRLPAVAAVLAGLLLGCDRSGTGEDCRTANELDGSPGARIGLCAPALFQVSDPAYRAISGKVYSGENPVVETPVRMDPSPGWPSDLGAPAFTTTTDQGGSFAPRGDVPFNFDLTAAVGGDVITARSIRNRYFEPTLDVPFPAATTGGSLDLNAVLDVAFRTHFDVVVTTPLPAGKKVVFFATGADAISASGDLEHGVTLVGDRFETAATLYAIAYDGTGDLATASSFAKADVYGTAGQSGLVQLAFVPFPRAYDLTLSGRLPEGFTVSSIDLLVAFSRTSRAYVTKLVPGVTKHVPNLVQDGPQYLAYRLLAHAADGRELDSGIVPFGFYLNEGKLDLTVELGSLAAPVSVAPAADASVGLDVQLEATGSGTLEHALAPVGTGPTIHIVTPPGKTALPPFSAVRTSPPHGAYTWTVRGFPNATGVESMSGRDARRNQASVTAAPRRILFP